MHLQSLGDESARFRISTLVIAQRRRLGTAIVDSLRAAGLRRNVLTTHGAAAIGDAVHDAYEAVLQLCGDSQLMSYTEKENQVIL